MSAIDKMRYYSHIYHTCLNKIWSLLDKESKQYNEFLVESGISVVPDLGEGGSYFYFSPEKQLTKQEVDELYKIYLENGRLVADNR